MKWLPVVGHEQQYEVSDLGMVRSVDSARDVKSRWGGTRLVRRKGRALKPRPLPTGYLRVAFGDGSEDYIHALVLKAFVGPRPDGKQAAHGDGNRANNNLSNLAWKTPVENNADKERHGTVARGLRNGMGRKTHCKRGHTFDDVNTRRANGKRHCRACLRQHQANRRASCA